MVTAVEHPAEPEAAESYTGLDRRLLRLAPMVAQLVLVLLAVQLYQLENRTLYHMLVLAAVGFVIHALLPLAYRLPFFVVLSFAAIFVVFGAAGGTWLLAAGLALIGACHLPARWPVRVLAVLVLGAVLAAGRAGWLPLPLGAAVWPILGAMFMFRIALYLHALKHDPEPPTVWRTLAYFFMLPNVAFPLFPVVDYTAFHRTYYDRDDWQIYETGVRWIVRGVVQLVLYRFVYLYVVQDPADVLDLTGLLQFMLGTFLLYLRVSGSFHLIIGVLHLFGFRLPETHHLYFLASSFNDFWRRINIYWKDFMMKLVYYPSFFRLRRWGGNTALVGATAIVFAATWLLHSYQWFWLRGGFPLEVQDAVFWGVLGLLVITNSLREIRRGRKRTLARPTGWNGGQAVRTVATFAFICLLWSIWSAESVGEWLGLWYAAGRVSAGGLVVILACVAAALAVAGYSWDVRDTRPAERPASFWRQPALHGSGVLGALLLLGTPTVQAWFGPATAHTLASLQQPTLNARDAGLQQRGYYENLDNPGRMSAQLWQTTAARPDDWPDFVDTPLRRDREDFIRVDLAPSTAINFKGAPVTIDAGGLRGRGHTRVKPAGTTRIALLGPSYVMGWGVGDDETFAAVLESRLNEEFGATGGGRFEVLNFAVPGHSLLQQLAMLEDRVFGYKPDIVVITSSANPLLRRFLVGHMLRTREADIEPPYRALTEILNSAGLDEYRMSGRPVPFATLRSVARRAGVDTRMPYFEAVRRAQLAADEVHAWTLAEAGRLIKDAGAVPVLLGLDVVTGNAASNLPDHATAEQAGFAVWNLLDIYDGVDPVSLRVAEWDPHPNALGHRMIAERMFGEVRRMLLPPQRALIQ